MPDPPARRPPQRSRWFVWLVGLLLAVNFGSVLLVQPSAQPRLRVPFSPYLVSAVQAGRVATIASTGNTVQGAFKLPVRYPPQSSIAQPTNLFSTEVPTFWHDNQLTALLESHHVGSHLPRAWCALIRYLPSAPSGETLACNPLETT